MKPIFAAICLFMNISVLLGSFLEAKAVNWEQQSEKLLQVSGVLLAAVPIGDPVTGVYRLGLFADLSILPKVNPKIGKKSEQVPSAPVHAVPALHTGGAFTLAERWKCVSGLHFGYLRPGMESIFGIKAKLSQFTAGGSLGLDFSATNAIHLQLDLGLHRSQAEITGQITSPASQDSFKANTSIFFLRPGILLTRIGLWANVTLGKKDSELSLEIPSDKTVLKTRDRLEGPFPFILQPALGYSHFRTGIVTAVAIMYEPARAYFPRVHLGWNYELKNEKAAPEIPKRKKVKREKL